MSKIIVGIIITALVAGGVYLSIGGASRTTAAPAQVAQSQAAADDTILAEGRVVPARSVALSFAAPGTVAEVLVAEGDSVAEGAPLARLDTRELELSLRQAQVAFAQAQASYDRQLASATPEELAGAEAQLAQAQANLRQTRGSVTQDDVVAARATLAQAQAALSQLQAGPKSTVLREAQATLDRAQANLQAQRDSLSAAKTSAELEMQQATAELTKAQAAYATAQQNWQYVQDTGNDPVRPTTVGADGSSARNKLNDTQRQQYRDALTEAEATMHAAESLLQQANVAFDGARQAEVSGIQAAEADLRSAQAGLDQSRTGATSDQLAAARAQVAEAQAGLNKLLGEQRAGSVAVAEAEVSSAEANIARLTADPGAADVALAKAQLEAAALAVEAADLALGKATILAPFAGTVAEVNLRVGELPNATSAGVVLADVTAWQIETTDLTELGVGRVAVGDAVALTFDALPDVELAGTVSKIATIGQNRQGEVTYTVTIALGEQNARLRWNMTTGVRITPR